jgi:hypothetical protein
MNDIHIGIAAHSHFYANYEKNAPVVELKHALKDCLREPLRRSDRFIQLALLGSALCARDQDITSDCAVVLTSHYGPVSNNALVQQQLFIDAAVPKPIHFVNTLGNAAGFYIARNLNLAGANHFVSGRHGGFVEALLLSTLLLQTGTRNVLIGAVDECLPPHQLHRRRIGVAENTTMAEGSHWLLLTAPDDERARRQLHLRRDIKTASESLLPPTHYGSELAGNIATFCEQNTLQQWSFSDAALAPYPTIEAIAAPGTQR